MGEEHCNTKCNKYTKETDRTGMEAYRGCMSCVGLWMESWIVFSVCHPDSISTRWPQLECVFLFTSDYKYTFCSIFLLIPLWLASHVLVPAGERTASPDCALHIPWPLSHNQPWVCLAFLLVHQDFWSASWCRSRFLQQIRGCPRQSWSSQINIHVWAAEHTSDALVLLISKISFACGASFF